MSLHFSPPTPPDTPPEEVVRSKCSAKPKMTTRPLPVYPVPGRLHEGQGHRSYEGQGHQLEPLTLAIPEHSGLIPHHYIYNHNLLGLAYKHSQYNNSLHPRYNFTAKHKPMDTSRQYAGHEQKREVAPTPPSDNEQPPSPPKSFFRPWECQSSPKPAKSKPFAHFLNINIILKRVI